MKWWAKAMSTLKQPNGIYWYQYQLHICHKVAKFMAKPINQSCVQLQLSAGLGKMEPFKDYLNIRGCLRSL